MTTFLMVALMFARPGGVTVERARAIALEGRGQPTWRFLLAVGVPADDPPHLQAIAPIFPLLNPPRGARKGRYHVHSPDGRRVLWSFGDSDKWEELK